MKKHFLILFCLLSTFVNAQQSLWWMTNKSEIIAPGDIGSLVFNSTQEVVSDYGIILGTNQYTIEFWIYPTDGYSSGLQRLPSLSSATLDMHLDIIQSGNNIIVKENDTQIITGVFTPVLKTWTHIALSKDNNNNVKLFVNGVQAGSTYVTNANWNFSARLYIGADPATHIPKLDGQISNVRVINGTGLYTSNFTPPTSKLTTIANTSTVLNTYNDATYLTDATGNRIYSAILGVVNSSPLNPFIVTEDKYPELLLHLDAGNDASYSGLGKNWMDLTSKGNNAVFNNSPNFTGAGKASYFSFDGIGSTYASVQPSVSMRNLNIALTVEAWVQTATTEAYHWFVRNDSGGYPYFIGINVFGQWQLCINDQGWGYNNGTLQATTNTWLHIVGVYNKTDIRMYINGTLTGNNLNYTNNINTPSVNHDTKIGGPGNIQGWNGKIGIVRIYNKALTPAEINFNFGSQKSRYGY